MRVWYFRDKNTGRVWARNRWGTPMSIPDMYSAPHKALYQLTKGKIRQQTEAGICQPEMVEAELKEVK